jgi:hypothetical protein
MAAHIGRPCDWAVVARRTEKENIMLDLSMPRISVDEANAEVRAMIDEARETVDEMDAPADWDAGTVTFDPYI